MSYPQAGGPRLADFLDGLPILTRWLAGHPVVWQTGQQDGPDRPNPSHNTHCSAFAAAATMYLDVYLLRPPHHGQTELANAQAKWLSGDKSFPGPTAEGAGWKALGSSGDHGALAAALTAATAGQLVLACYETPRSAGQPERPGHIAIVRPGDAHDEKVPQDGPAVMMAGEKNARSLSMRQAFAAHAGAWPDKIALFAHSTALQRDV